jgi:anti-sigma factor ChrR (cupin superfamily)
MPILSLKTRRSALRTSLMFRKCLGRGLHEHTALEQTYVIEGTLEDHEGVCGPGQFVWRPAGNQHEAVAPNGAVLLGFFLKPNRFAYGERFFTEKGER